MRDDEALELLRAAEADRPDPAAAPLRGTLRLLRAFAPADRSACCARDELLAFADGTLAPRDAELIARHLDGCPYCAGDLADYRALLAPPLFELAVRLVRDGFELLRHQFDAAERTAPATVRGDEPGGLTVRADQGDLRFSLRLTHAGVGADLRLQVEAGDGPARARVNLCRGQDLLESRRLSGEELVFPAVVAGEYTLAVEPTDGRDSARIALALDCEPTR